jgi:hypothetical protein
LTTGAFPWQGIYGFSLSTTSDTEILPIKRTNDDDMIDPLLKDDFLLGAREQSEAPYRVQKGKSTRLKEAVVIDYSPPHSPKSSPAFTDPIISPTLTLLSSASPLAGDCNHNAECLTAPDLIYIGTSLLNGTISCRTGNCTSTRGEDSQNPPEVDWAELQANFEEFRDIPVVDLTEDKPLAYDNLLSRYTTISSSTCSSVKGTSGDDDSKGLSDKSCLPSEIPPTNTIHRNPVELNKDVQVEPQKSGIKLRLNPPKPKILLRVKRPEQVSSQKYRGTVGKKKPRRKRRSQY